MKRRGAFACSILVASVLPALALSLGALDPYETPESLLGYSLIFYVPCLYATSITGIPIFYLLKRLRLVRWWSLFAGGLVGGAFVFRAFGFEVFDVGVLHSDWDELLLFSLLGGATALLFWIVWKPDGMTGMPPDSSAGDSAQS